MLMIFPIVCTFQVFDCLTTSPKTAHTQKWSSKSVEILKNQIKVSDAVYFQATKKIDATKFEGILTFKLNAAQLLIIAKQAESKCPSIAFLS